MDLQVPVLYHIRLTPITSHIQNWVLFLHWHHQFIFSGVICHVTHWAPTELGSLSFNVISFCLFILFMRFTWRVTFKLVLEKAEEPEIKLPTSGRSLKQQENPEKHIFLLYWLYQNICMDHHKFQKILKEVGIPDHLTCLLRNLYADQETTVRTWHGTTDWFQMAKGVHQDCILSP